MCMQQTQRSVMRSHIRTDHRSGGRSDFSAKLAARQCLVRRCRCMLLLFQSWYAVISASGSYSSNCSKTPRAKNANPSGLGRAIINRKAKDARQTDGSSLVRCGCIYIEASQPCLLVHNRHRSILSSAICHSGKRSRCVLEYGTIGRHRIYCR